MDVSFTRFYPPWRVFLSSKRLRVISTIISVSNKIMKGCKYSGQRYNKPDRRKRNRFAFSTSILFFRSFHSYFQVGRGRLISDDNHRNISRNGQDTPWMKVNFTRPMPLTVRFYDPLFFSPEFLQFEGKLRSEWQLFQRIRVAHAQWCSTKRGWP